MPTSAFNLRRLPGWISLSPHPHPQIMLEFRRLPLRQTDRPSLLLALTGYLRHIKMTTVATETSGCILERTWRSRCVYGRLVLSLVSMN